MKMSKFYFLTLSLIVSISFHVYGCTSTDDSIAENLFLKCEKHAILERAKIEKERFLDPVERNRLFFEIVEKQSPDLLKYTEKYKYGLLKLLVDLPQKRDNYTESDIVNILYNLCLSDYLVILDSVYANVILNKLEFKILESLVIQDVNITTQLMQNYKNQSVQQALDKIRKGIENSEIRIPNNNSSFLEYLELIRSGEIWENTFSHFEEKYAPLLHTRYCK